MTFQVRTTPRTTNYRDSFIKRKNIDDPRIRTRMYCESENSFKPPLPCRDIVWIKKRILEK